MPLKAELHCHIEGAASPQLVTEQAKKYGKDVSPFIRDGSFVWDDFTADAGKEYVYRFHPLRGTPQKLTFDKQQSTPPRCGLRPSICVRRSSERGASLTR